eukprot:2976814-Alexandrium_andersonii.AAC.1
MLLRGRTQVELGQARAADRADAGLDCGLNLAVLGRELQRFVGGLHDGGRPDQQLRRVPVAGPRNGPGRPADILEDAMFDDEISVVAAGIHLISVERVPQEHLLATVRS